jgi:hypothetical protein
VEDLPPSTDELVAQGDRAIARSHELIARLDELLQRSHDLLSDSETDQPPSDVIDLRRTDLPR